MSFGEDILSKLGERLEREIDGNQLLLDEIKARYDEIAELRSDKFSAVEHAIDPLLALLFAVIHGHTGTNADGDEMIRLSASDYKRIQAAVEGE